MAPTATMVFSRSVFLTIAQVPEISRHISHTIAQSTKRELSLLEFKTLKHIFDY
jgi:hypothetical protein